MSEDHPEHRDEPVLITSPGRMMRGIIICAVTLAVGFAFIFVYFDEMFAYAPPVVRLQPTTPPENPPPAQAGITQITILAGAAVSGAPDYDPDDATVPLGNKVVWNNADNVPHTATSGTGPEDAESGARFDTNIIEGGAKSAEMEITGAEVGETIPYYCFVHPFMTSQLTITEAEEGGAPTDSSPLTGAITIPPGASLQGNPAYDPAELTVKLGETVLVTNADNVPHTVTSGTGPEDPASGQSFDTSIMDAGAKMEISTANLSAGDYPYYCIVHPYMKGSLTVTE